MKILNFPELRQAYEYDCGASALQSVLAYYNIDVREELIIKYLKTNSKNGTSIKNMTQVLKKFNLKFESRKMTIMEIKDYINKKIPVLILLRAWDDDHWVVAIGYNKEKIIFEDPYSIKRSFLKNKEFLKKWHTNEIDSEFPNHGIAVFSKKPILIKDEIIHMK
ncbi:MAG: cysteine peptidase family C39 domain-containing protein [Candidatus Moraniibacteriota bacterium]